VDDDDGDGDGCIQPRLIARSIDRSSEDEEGEGKTKNWGTRYPNRSSGPSLLVPPILFSPRHLSIARISDPARRINHTSRLGSPRSHHHLPSFLRLLRSLTTFFSPKERRKTLKRDEEHDDARGVSPVLAMEKMTMTTKTM
jgi:hypothetical protein